MNNDLISRSALERELLDKGFYPAIARAAIEKAPAVDAEPVVHAHWHHGRICSNCGAPIPTDSAVDYLDENDNSYCYGCGAKMDEETT